MRLWILALLAALAVPLAEAGKPVAEPSPFAGAYRGTIGSTGLDIFLGIGDDGRISVGGFAPFLCSNLDGSGRIGNDGVMTLTIVYTCLDFRPNGRAFDRRFRLRVEAVVSLDAEGNLVGTTTDGQAVFFAPRP